MNHSSLIRVGGVPEHFNLPWHLALEADAFADDGLNVEFIDIPGGTGAMTRALSEGELDVAILLAEGGVADICKGANNRLVKAYTHSPLIWGIHVASSSELQTEDDIRGQRYAISRNGSGSHLMAIVDAAERGWDPTDMKFNIIKNLDGAREALANGTAEVFFWEKFMTQPLVDSGEFRRVGERVVPWPAFMASVREAFLSERAADVKKTLEIAQRFAASLKQNGDAPALIAERYGLFIEDAKEWFGHIEWCNDFEMPTSAIELIMGYLRRLDLIPDTDFEPSDVWQAL